MIYNLKNTARKYIYIVFLILLYSCTYTSKQSTDKKKSNLIEPEDFEYSIDSNKKGNSLIMNDNAFFDITEYKKLYDSILSIALNKRITTKVDKLPRKKILFNELKNTSIENITDSAVQINFYRFSLDNSNSQHIRSNLIIIEFPTKYMADSIYYNIAKESVKKAHVPGLTYSYDYVTIKNNTLYWLHLSCGHSYEIYKKLQKYLFDKIHPNKKGIECKCGKVKCVIM